MTRATVIARRRRRTSGLTALVLTAIAVVASGVAPWWIAMPPAALLAYHLALLRVAVGMDTARRHAAAQARAAARARALEARRAAEAAEPAEVIDLIPWTRSSTSTPTTAAPSANNRCASTPRCLLTLRSPRGCGAVR